MYTSAHKRLIPIIALLLCGGLLSLSGCKRVSDHLSEKRKAELAEQLEGTWRLDTSLLEVDEDAVISSTSDSVTANSGQDAEAVNSNMLIGEAFGLSIAFEFEADGGFEMTVGPEHYSGTWAIPQKDGDRYVFVTSFPMADVLQDSEVEGIDPATTKQLVERLHFVDDTTIEIEDDEGNRYRMKKVVSGADGP